MKKKASYLIIGTLFLSLTAMGQTREEDFFAGKDRNAKEKQFFESNISETKVDLQRTIKLEKDSKSEDVILHIKKKTKKLDLLISSSINNGKLTIEVYSPDNIKQGNYTVGTQLKSEKKEIVNGNIRKSLVEPQAGEWKVKIIPTDASGTIKIQTAVLE